MMKIPVVALWMVLIFGCQHKGTDRSQLHATPGTPGNVEPVSLVYLGGAYHLVYSSPDASNKTNSLHQATSQDLIHWRESPKSTFPKSDSSFLRGAVVIDSNNLTGYGTGGGNLLVAILSNTGHVKPAEALPVLAFSNDDGDSWAEAKEQLNFPEAFLKNPQNTGILWHADTKKWIMSLVLENHAEFYSSADLRSWVFESMIGNDFFPEEVRWQRAALFSTGNGLHWVLLADIKKSGVSKTSGGTVYFIGDFDGHHFTNRSGELHWLDYGENIFGTLVSIAGDGRVINMGWRSDGDTGKPGSGASQMITVPRELQVEITNTESFISASPVREIQTIYGKETKLAPTTVSYKAGDVALISGVRTPVEVILKFNTSDIQKGSFPKRLGVRFGNENGEEIRFGYDRFGYYYLGKSGPEPPAPTAADQPLKMPFDHADSTMSLRFIMDGSTIECFSEGGKCVMTVPYSSGEPFNTLKLFAVNGNINLLEGKMIELDPALPK